MIRTLLESYPFSQGKKSVLFYARQSIRLFLRSAGTAVAFACLYGHSANLLEAQPPSVVGVPSVGVSSAEYMSLLSPEAMTPQRASHAFPIAPYPPPPRPVVTAQLPPAVTESPPQLPAVEFTPAAAPANAPIGPKPMVEPAQSNGLPTSNAPQPSAYFPQPVSAPIPWFGPNQIPFEPATNQTIAPPDAIIPAPANPSELKEPLLPPSLIRQVPNERLEPSSTPRAAWLAWLDPTPKGPDYLVGADMLSFRRGNDSGGTISNGNGLDRFGRSVAGRYTIAKLDGELSRKEFVFTGPFEWDRSKSAIGPVSTTLSSSTLPPSSFGAVNGSDLHTQFHSVRFSSYELNHRSTGDGFSSIHGGLRIIDYREDYRLEATQGTSVGGFRLSADNLLVGGQLGIHLARPWSQRIHVGIGGSAGMYGNLADGSYRLTDNATTLAQKSDDDFRMVLLLQPAAKMNYRLTQNSEIRCGYECMYFSGLATTSDQRLGEPLASSPWFLRTTNDTLLYGWTVGFDARF
jgi:hypothetical protein